ncbi:MAG TPA: hypothetical protein VF625_17580 [Longimicrobium sp.]
MLGTISTVLFGVGGFKAGVEYTEVRVANRDETIAQLRQDSAWLHARSDSLSRVVRAPAPAAPAPVAVIDSAQADSVPPPPRRRLDTRVLVERARPADPFDGELVFTHLGMTEDSTVNGGRRASFSVKSASGREKSFTDLPILSDVEFDGYRLSVVTVAADWLTLRVATIGPGPR